ncbi:MAG: hypothetical protein Q9216_004246 [Gyalolechia sp. 2 TL-2023]
MPSVPPFSRSESIKDYEAQCKPIEWQERRTKTADGVDIALAVSSVTGSKPTTSETRKHIAVIYFQGNGGSLPARLPALSSVLRKLQQDAPSLTTYTFVGLSYRGFWTSRGRPSELGIGLDAAAAINYALAESPAPTTKRPTSLVLWGQSIGAGVATSAAAALSSTEHGAMRGRACQPSGAQEISGLLLETPFVSIRAMLTTIYPQKWLPYRYLGPFLRNHWDSRLALQRIGASSTPSPKLLILQAANDELVPNSQSSDLEKICQNLQMNVERRVVSNALHNEVTAKPQGRLEVVSFLQSFG